MWKVFFISFSLSILPTAHIVLPSKIFERFVVLRNCTGQCSTMKIGLLDYFVTCLIEIVIMGLCIPRPSEILQKNSSLLRIVKWGEIIDGCWLCTFFAQVPEFILLVHVVVHTSTFELMPVFALLQCIVSLVKKITLCRLLSLSDKTITLPIWHLISSTLWNNSKI